MAMGARASWVKRMRQRGKQPQIVKQRQVEQHHNQQVEKQQQQDYVQASIGAVLAHATACEVSATD
jgi:hypothetical protein